MKQDNTLQPRVLFVGPIAPPVTGQAVAFTAVYEGIEVKKKYLVNHNLTGKNIFAKVFGTFRTVFFVTYILLTKKVDVVYFTCSRSFLGSVKDVVLIMAARAAGARLVNHLHGADFKQFYEALPAWYRSVIHFVYLKIDTSIVLLKEMKDQFVMFPDMHLEVVHNFYDETLVCTPEELQKKHERKNESVQLLYFSNVMATKGIFELLDAFERVSHTDDKITLHIAGDFVADENMSRSEVQKVFTDKIKKLPRVTYHGVVRGETKRKLLCSSDIFILPSYYRSEAVPISLIEAMATRNALVITNHNYLASFSNNVNELVPVCDATAIAHAIKSFIENPEKLINAKKANYNYAISNYSEGEYVKKLNNILNQS